MMKKYSLILITLILVLGFYTCDKDDDNDGPGPNEVWIENNTFIPEQLTVDSGTTVKWTNKDNVSHTVTSTTQIFNSGTIGPGGTFQYTFNNLNEFPYICTIHTGMEGSVLVLVEAK
jgi:plastocyanin